MNVLFKGLSALTMLTMTITAAAVPSEVKIKDISYGGTGCPQGSVGQILASDHESFTLLFDDYIAEVGPTVSRREGRKFCQITLELYVPQGWQYTVAQFDYRGYADLDRRVQGTQTSTYYFDSSREGKFSTTLSGSVHKDYKITDRLGISSLVWSPCGETKLLNIKSQLNLTSRNSRAYGLMTIDSLDGTVEQKYGLQWRRCH